MVTPKIQMALSPIAEKSGKVNKEPQAVGSMPLAAWPVGTSTSCFAVNAPPPPRVTKLTTTPAKTATREPDNTLVKLWAFMNEVSHRSKMARQTPVTVMAVGAA